MAVHAVAIREPRRLVVALEHIVIHEVQACAHLEHVLAAARVCEVVTETESLLDEVLCAQIAADVVIRVVTGHAVRVHARRQSRIVRAGIPAETRIVHFRFVQPRAPKSVVPKLADRNVLPVVHRLVESTHRGRAVHVGEVPDV